MKEDVQTQRKVWWVGNGGADFLDVNDAVVGFPGGGSQYWVWSFAGGHSFC